MEKDTTASVKRTFSEAITGGRNDSYLLLLEGANHFCLADPFDFTTGRPFLDFSPTQPAEKTRLLIAETIDLFIAAHVRYNSDAITALQQLLNNNYALIKSFECK